jgi:glycosyltransferase involved in cell wall biosynthesis
MDDTLKVAFVHDWLTGMRGGEKVLEALLKLYPQADLYTLLHNPGSVSPFIENRKIYTSFVNNLPLKSNRYRNYLPLFPTAIEMFNFKNYDLIISTSHCVAKGIRTPPTTMHISYIHSPMRYIWDMYDDYFPTEKLGYFSKMIIPLFSNYLRIWDVTSSNRVDFFIANSKHVANRIWKYYRREATVITPPVDTEFSEISEKRANYYVIISALVPYKRIDLAIQVFNELGLELLVIGNGPERKQLQKTAKNNIIFLDWLPSQNLIEYYSSCKALIFPGEEDFGIVPVETQLCGRPVIAYRRGGVLESVIGFDGNNENECSGVFFNEQTVDSLKNALKQFERINWDSKFIRNHAMRFSKERFIATMQKFISDKISAFRGEVNYTG